MLDQFCERNPDVLLVVRPHRARNEIVEKELIDLVQAKRGNFIDMDRYQGPFSYSTIHDGLAVCDGVVSHASTTILDALYSGLPSAVLENRLSRLNSLPKVDDLLSLEAFSKNLRQFRPKDNALRKNYGEIDENLDRAAGYIEDYMAQIP